MIYLNKVFEMKKIIYDFDGTLTPFSIPRFSILEKCGYEDGALNPKFLNEVKTRMKNENLDLYVSFYKTMFDKMNENNIELKDINFCYGAEDIEYNKGVISFLENLHKNNIFNYVLSSGLKVYLEKTKISPFIKDIFGTTFKYNENDEVIDFDILMNDKKKVNGIKKILESLNIEDDDCSELIYIGDGLTDLDAMEFIKEHGGISIFVCQDLDGKDLEKIKENPNVDYYFKADYSSDSDLSMYINKICGI